jgi:hypothetical protein
MKSCREIKSRLYLFRDGELPDNEAAEVEAHCAACADCRSILEALRAADGPLGRLRMESPKLPAGRDPLGEAIRYIEAAAPVRRRRRVEIFGRWGTILRPVLGAAVLALVCILFYQSVRDSMLIADMEQQAGVAGAKVMSEKTAPGDLNSVSDVAGKLHTAGLWPQDISPGRQDSLLEVLSHNDNMAGRLRELYASVSGMTSGQGFDRNKLSAAIGDARKVLLHIDPSRGE